MPGLRAPSRAARARSRARARTCSQLSVARPARTRARLARATRTAVPSIAPWIHSTRGRLARSRAGVACRSVRAARRCRSSAEVPAHILPRHASVTRTRARPTARWLPSAPGLRAPSRAARARSRARARTRSQLTAVRRARTRPRRARVTGTAAQWTALWVRLEHGHSAQSRAVVVIGAKRVAPRRPALAELRARTRPRRSRAASVRARSIASCRRSVLGACAQNRAVAPVAPKAAHEA